MHDLSQHVFILPTIDDWVAGDDRELVFRVVDAEGDPVDISQADVAWRLFERAYHDAESDAVLSGSDSGVELVTDSRVDTSAGQWAVRVDGAATNDEWGAFYHRPRVEQADGTVASWRGEIVLTA